MELKKAPKADMESRRNVFFMIGLVVSLGIILLAFEWTAKPSKAESLGSMNALDVEEEIIPITREQEIKPPPPIEQIMVSTLGRSLKISSAIVP